MLIEMITLMPGNSALLFALWTLVQLSYNKTIALEQLLRNHYLFNALRHKEKLNQNWIWSATDKQKEYKG